MPLGPVISPIPGSSPHTRGAHQVTGVGLERERIIPAYAGSTRATACRWSRGPDHPRIRGEHPRSCSTVAVSLGSSPHTRGARGPDHDRDWAVGIIPAYAGSTPPWSAGRPSPTDHPRIRGEHAVAIVKAAWEGGSSPHTRGAHRSDHPCHSRLRIIPAYAGSTSNQASAPSKTADHPRIRGEHFAFPELRLYRAGSSPHTRGAHPIFDEAYRKERIIPAYAGSTLRRHGYLPTRSDHPRIRGEHRLDIPWPQAMQGSSPHTRGARTCMADTPEEDGIIPAYAGSTRWRRRASGTEWDHPRIRGEHPAAGFRRPGGDGSSPHTRGAHSPPLINSKENGIIPAYAGSTPGDEMTVGKLAGSSPHTRGARGKQPGRADDGGIIPAYAGSTGSPASIRATVKDHPRIRGEHKCGSRLKTTSPGSSPHTRGARFDGESCRRTQRIIPAYAGSTSRRRTRPPGQGDHPRIRGEHWVALMDFAVFQGSSPHTRGALRQVGLGGAGRGIIPAYAGSTPAPSCGAVSRRDHPRIRGEHPSN